MFTLFVWYVLIGVVCTFLSMSLLVFAVIQRAFLSPLQGLLGSILLHYKQQVVQTQCVSKSDELIPRLIKTDDLFCSSPGIDKRVNKNPNNLISNEPILENKKNNLKSRVGSISYTQHPGICRTRNMRNKLLLLVFFFKH